MPDIKQLFDYEVLDADRDRIGTVESLWVDEDTGRLEFIGVKSVAMGGLHVVPAVNASINEPENQIQVPFDEDLINDAPTFEEDKNLSDEEERSIYAHYSVPMPERMGHGLEAGRERGMLGEERERPMAGNMGEGREEARIPLAEEELSIGKREVPTGEAHLRKVVRTEHVSQPVELRREEIHLERVPATGDDLPPDAFQEREIDMQAMREEPVVEKRAHVAEEVRAYKTTETERRNVEADLRKEEIEGEGDMERRGKLDRDRNLGRDRM